MGWTLLLLVCELLLGRNTFAEFQPMRMPSADIRMSVKLLHKCNVSTVALKAETIACEDKVREVLASTRCLNLRALMETAAVRLYRLESSLTLLHAASLERPMSECMSERNELAKMDATQMEAELICARSEVEELQKAVASVEEKGRNLTTEISALQNNSREQECEFERLETKMKQLEIQLAFDNSTLESLNENMSQLHNITHDALSSQQEANANCHIQTREMKTAIDACSDQVELLQIQLEGGSFGDAWLRAVQDRLQACTSTVDACRARTESCEVQLAKAIRVQHQRQVGALREQAALQGCKRELAAITARQDRCDGRRRELAQRTRALLLTDDPMVDEPSSRISMCQGEMDECWVTSGQCHDVLDDARVTELSCEQEMSTWWPRWQQCNKTRVELGVTRLVPLQELRSQLETKVNDTLAARHECLVQSARIRANFSLAQEKLMRAGTELRRRSKQINSCRAAGCKINLSA